MSNLDLNQFKFHEVEIDMAAIRQGNISTGTTFFSFDQRTAKKIINIKLNGANHDLTGATVIIGFHFLEADARKIYDSDDECITIEDVAVGKVSILLPNDIYAYSGDVLVWVGVKHADGRSFDSGIIYTTFLESWIDQDLEELQQFYVQRFETLREEIEAKAADMIQQLGDIIGEGLSWDNISNRPEEFPPLGHTHPWADITSRPTIPALATTAPLNTLATAATGTGTAAARNDHRHAHPLQLATARTITIGNLGRAFNGTANISFSLAEIGAASRADLDALAATVESLEGGSGAVTWDNIGNRPEEFPPLAHTHNADEITMGTLAIARIPTGTTGSTVALGDHAHAWDAITGRPTIIALATTAPLNTLATAATGTGTAAARNDHRHAHPPQLATARNITIGNQARSFNGTAAISYTLAEIGAVPRTDFNTLDARVEELENTPAPAPIIYRRLSFPNTQVTAGGIARSTRIMAAEEGISGVRMVATATYLDPIGTDNFATRKINFINLGGGQTALEVEITNTGTAAAAPLGQAHVIIANP